MSVLSDILARGKLWARAYKYRWRLDHHEIAKMLELTRPGDTALDLGAHKGAYTYWLERAVGRNGRVIAVEPQKELADRLSQLWRNRPHVTVHWAAADLHTGEAMLSVRSERPSHGASILGFEDAGPVAGISVVPTISLPDLASAHALRRIDFIKCDTEGTEVRIFRGGLELLRRYRPVVLCECELQHGRGGSDNVRGILSVFRDADYQAWFFFGDSLLDAQEFRASKHQMPGVEPYGNNFLFIPRPPAAPTTTPH